MAEIRVVRFTSYLMENGGGKMMIVVRYTLNKENSA